VPCFRRPLLVPALTGRPLLRGLAPGCPPVRDPYSWGFAAYGEDARAIDLPDPALCGRARERGFDQVLVLESLREPGRNRLLACRDAGATP
jgi:hypothetical protein